MGIWEYIQLKEGIWCWEWGDTTKLRWNIGKWLGSDHKQLQMHGSPKRLAGVAHHGENPTVGQSFSHISRRFSLVNAIAHPMSIFRWSNPNFRCLSHTFLWYEWIWAPLCSSHACGYHGDSTHVQTTKQPVIDWEIPQPNGGLWLGQSSKQNWDSSFAITRGFSHQPIEKDISEIKT